MSFPQTYHCTPVNGTAAMTENQAQWTLERTIVKRMDDSLKKDQLDSSNPILIHNAGSSSRT
eukprot:m.394790 g.394790  ORF g.394790 m.394790 type:complete len:62 (-) comp56380_c0_seq19:1537-1722(-)